MKKGKKAKRSQFSLYCSHRMCKDKGDNANGFTSPPNQMIRKSELKKGLNQRYHDQRPCFFIEGRGAEARFFVPPVQQASTLLTKRLTGWQSELKSLVNK